eukprot:COSAG02_NODE_1412_length_12756_cov_57.891048_6_plen_88_part_00
MCERLYGIFNSVCMPETPGSQAAPGPHWESILGRYEPGQGSAFVVGWWLIDSRRCSLLWSAMLMLSDMISEYLGPNWRVLEASLLPT